MTRRPSISRAGDVTSQIMSVLSETFQSGGLISAQVVIPPDAICRRQARSLKRCTLAVAKNNIVARTLGNLFLRKKLERRVGQKGLLEYRLPQTRKRGGIAKAIEDAWLNGSDPYKAHSNRSTVSVYLCRLRKKYGETTVDKGAIQ